MASVEIQKDITIVLALKPEEAAYLRARLQNYLPGESGEGREPPEEAHIRRSIFEALPDDPWQRLNENAPEKAYEASCREFV